MYISVKEIIILSFSFIKYIKNRYFCICYWISKIVCIWSSYICFSIFIIKFFNHILFSLQHIYSFGMKSFQSRWKINFSNYSLCSCTINHYKIIRAYPVYTNSICGISLFCPKPFILISEKDIVFWKKTQYFFKILISKIFSFNKWKLKACTFYMI